MTADLDLCFDLLLILFFISYLDDSAALRIYSAFNLSLTSDTKFWSIHRMLGTNLENLCLEFLDSISIAWNNNLQSRSFRIPGTNRVHLNSLTLCPIF